MRKLCVVAALMGLVAVAPSASAATSSDQPPVAGAEPFAGGWAVPIQTRAPAWFDKAFYDKVVAAGTDGVPLPPGVTMPTAAGTDAMPGIHPGLWLVTLLSQG